MKFRENSTQNFKMPIFCYNQSILKNCFQCMTEFDSRCREKQNY